MGITYTVLGTNLEQRLSGTGFFFPPGDKCQSLDEVLMVSLGGRCADSIS